MQQTKVDFINPFLQAALEVLQAELGGTIHRGRVSYREMSYTAQEVTTLVAVTGSIRGVVLFGMSERMALDIVSHMLGERVKEFDDLAQSGVGEVGNVITGRASTLLEEAGYPSTIAPPIVISGRGVRISTLTIRQIIIPLFTKHGELEIAVALREAV